MAARATKSRSDGHPARPECLSVPGSPLQDAGGGAGKQGKRWSPGGTCAQRRWSADDGAATGGQVTDRRSPQNWWGAPISVRRLTTPRGDVASCHRPLSVEAGRRPGAALGGGASWGRSAGSAAGRPSLPLQKVITPCTFKTIGASGPTGIGMVPRFRGSAVRVRRCGTLKVRRMITFRAAAASDRRLGPISTRNSADLGTKKEARPGDAAGQPGPDRPCLRHSPRR